jgi:HD superfamily phosphohydrolase
MLRAISTRSADSEVIFGHAKVVRLAALLHDVGHLPLSHVSERYYTEHECSDVTMAREVRKLAEEVGGALVVPVPKLSECLSLAVTLSSSFHDLLTGPAGYSAKEIATAAVAILGRPPSAEDAFVAQVMSKTR